MADFDGGDVDSGEFLNYVRIRGEQLVELYAFGNGMWTYQNPHHFCEHRDDAFSVMECRSQWIGAYVGWTFKQ